MNSSHSAPAKWLVRRTRGSTGEASEIRAGSIGPRPSSPLECETQFTSLGEIHYDPPVVKAGLAGRRLPVSLGPGEGCVLHYRERLYSATARLGNVPDDSRLGGEFRSTAATFEVDGSGPDDRQDARLCVQSILTSTFGAIDTNVFHALCGRRIPRVTLHTKCWCAKQGVGFSAE